MGSSQYDFRNSRAQIPLMVVTANRSHSHQLRGTLKNLGFGNIAAELTLTDCLARYKRDGAVLILFDAKLHDLEGAQFIEELVANNSETVVIPFSGEPRVDDVFSLLRAGARHFITLPFQADRVEEIILRAVEGPPLRRSILESGDRNTSLAGAMLNLLDKVTLLQRESREFSSLLPLFDEEHKNFTALSEVAKSVCEGSPEELREKIMGGCIQRAEAQNTRLGRARSRLRKQRDLKKTNSMIIERPASPTRAVR